MSDSWEEQAAEVETANAPPSESRATENISIEDSEGAAGPTAENGVSTEADPAVDVIDEKVIALSIDNSELDEGEPETAGGPEAEGDDEDGGEEGEGESIPEDVLRKHLNIVFIGHVDAGKSTISGQIMYLTGGLDERTLEKYEREAKAKNRESWKFAWALDTTDQERAKGKTEEVGRATFKTESKRYTILDAPGHKNFVPHMIGGASQADVGILVISARKGEFETGFEKGGQTREHALLAKTVGLRQLIVVINKMDDPTVEWDKARYDECVSKLTPYLKQVGWSTKDVFFMPLSGLTGLNMMERLTKEMCPWYDGPSMLEFLDNLKPPERLVDAPVRLPINNKYREMGTVVMGKLESGVLLKNQTVLIMPNKVPVELVSIAIEAHELNRAEPGDNVKLRLRGIEEEDVRVGFVICDTVKPVPCVRMFDAQIIILEHKSIICAGYMAVLHIHAAIEECILEDLLALVDKKTGKVIQKKPKFIRPGQTMSARISVQQPICVEVYKEFPQLGRFMLRDEGKTVGVGVITALHEYTASASKYTEETA